MRDMLHDKRRKKEMKHDFLIDGLFMARLMVDFDFL